MSHFDPQHLPSGAIQRFGTSCFRHQSPVSTICWHPSGDQIFSAGWDLQVARWDIQTGKRTQTFRCPGVSLSLLAVSADGRRLAGANYRHGLWVWDLDSSEIIWSLGGKELEISAIAISNSGHRVATLGPIGCTE